MSLIWQVRGEEQYFIGSIHLLPETVPIPQQIWDIVGRVRRVVFESDFANMQPPSSRFYSEGESLREKIPAALHDRAVEFWRIIGATADLQTFKPWFAAFAIGPRRAELRGVKFSRGVERQVYDRSNDLKRDFLEGEEIWAVFDNAPIEEQCDLLGLCLRPDAEIEADYFRILFGWSRGDLDDLGRLVAEKEITQPTITKGMITGRNELWMPKILRLLQEGTPTAFVAGALHFAGPKALQTLLAERGVELVMI